MFIGNRIEVDRQIAHQPFDDVGPQPVVVAEFDAARHGQTSVFDDVLIGVDLHGVLHVALRQGADRRRPETDQDR